MDERQAKSAQRKAAVEDEDEDEDGVYKAGFSAREVKVASWEVSGGFPL